MLTFLVYLIFKLELLLLVAQLKFHWQNKLPLASALLHLENDGHFHSKCVVRIARA